MLANAVPARKAMLIASAVPGLLNIHNKPAKNNLIPAGIIKPAIRIATAITKMMKAMFLTFVMVVSFNYYINISNIVGIKKLLCNYFRIIFSESS